MTTVTPVDRYMGRRNTFGNMYLDRPEEGSKDNFCYLNLTVKTRKGYPITLNGYAKEKWKIRKSNKDNHAGYPDVWHLIREYKREKHDLELRYNDWDLNTKVFLILPNFELELVQVEFIGDEKKEEFYRGIFEEVKNIVKARDEHEGEGWSNDTDEICKLVADFTVNKMNEISSVVVKGTRQRRYFKGWETQLFRMLGE